MRTLRDKKCLVTGAASRIGREIALRLAKQGGDVYLLDVNESMLMETVGLARKHGMQAIERVCDVSDPAANDAAVDDLLERWQTLDVLVNNAGVCYYGPTPKNDSRANEQVASDQRLVLVTPRACFVYYACRLASKGGGEWRQLSRNLKLRHVRKRLDRKAY